MVEYTKKVHETLTRQAINDLLEHGFRVYSDLATRRLYAISLATPTNKGWVSINDEEVIQPKRHLRLVVNQ